MKIMKLINRYTGEMRCSVCGNVHLASIRPHSGGRFYRGSWQCSNQMCPHNRRVWTKLSSVLCAILSRLYRRSSEVH